MDNPILEAESTLTDRYQTTIPGPIRKALGLDKRDKVVYRLSGSGKVSLVRARSKPVVDAALGPFLALLDKRLKSHPKRIVAYGRKEAEDDLALVKGVKLD